MKILSFGYLTPSSLDFFKLTSQTLASTARKVGSFVQEHPLMISGIFTLGLVGVSSATLSNPSYSFGNSADLSACLQTAGLQESTISVLTNAFAEKFFNYGEFWGTALNTAREIIGDDFSPSPHFVRSTSLFIADSLRSCGQTIA